ncbi:hypothetical protein GCM10022421_19910 [Oceanisphaera sediminis]|uniref:Surface antigen domain-containing protein n=1 Tax=Oceanisphaera sediminis TaxID=981381 RepID=A0ABP7E190_9GAMM
MQLSSKNLLLPLVVLSIISGCASQQQGTHGAQQAINNSELNQYLSSATANAAVLASSPWGPKVQIMAGQPYFAASGRTCRKLQVSQPNGNTQHQIACKADTGNWTLTRPVTQLLTP